MTDQNRKTLRSYYCRDYLWELFEVMTRDLGCSMDYLINESMRHYARSRNYSLAGPRAEGPQAAPAVAPYSTPQPQVPAPPAPRAAPPSIAQLNAAPESVVNVKDADVLFVGFDGALVIVVLGAVVSTVHVEVAGVASTLPAAARSFAAHSSTA